MLYLRTKLPQESANVGKYTSHMDPMGKYALGVQRPLNKWSFRKDHYLGINFINNSKGPLF